MNHERNFTGADIDYEYDESECPKCGHSPTHMRRCDVIGCDDGWIDMHEYDDPMLFDEGEEEMCRECNGTGIQRWCPNCGFDMTMHTEHEEYDDNE